MGVRPFGLLRVAEQPRSALADDRASEALVRPVDDPGRVDRAVVLLQAQHVRVFAGVVDVGQPRVVAAGEQVRGHDGLRRLVDDRLPWREVEVAAGRRDDAEALGLGDVSAHEQAKLLGGVDERVDHEHLRVVALRDEVHLHVRAALHQERVRLLADLADRLEQVAHQHDLEAVDPLELEVVAQSILVACAGRSQRDEPRRSHSPAPG